MAGNDYITMTYSIAFARVCCMPSDYESLNRGNGSGLPLVFEINRAPFTSFHLLMIATAGADTNTKKSSPQTTNNDWTQELTLAMFRRVEGLIRI